MNIRYLNYLSTYKHIIKDAFKMNQKLMDKFLKAVDLYNKNKNIKAVNLLLKLIKETKNNSDYAAIYAFLGIIYEEIGYPNLAMDAYLTSIEYDNEISTVHSNLGLIYRTNGDFVEAKECFHRALEINDKNSYAYVNLANVYFREGNNELALENALRSLKYNSSLYQAAELVCCIYLINENEEEYRKYYQIAISNGSKKKRIENILEEYRKINEELNKE